jgi:molecular chaperone GrpE
MPNNDPKNEETADLNAKVEAAKAEAEKTETAEKAVSQEASPAPGNKEDADPRDQQIASLKDSLMRAMADSQNMKRRFEEDRARLIRFANAELLKELLPIIDHFDRACAQLPASLAGDAWVKGVLSTHEELMRALEKIGVKKIETAGKKLDPTLHEAVLQGEGEKDVILEEYEPGYTHNGETLKPAKVKVGGG